MRVFSPIIFPQSARSVAVLAAQFLHRGGVGGQSVGRDRLRMDALVVEQFPGQLQRCSLVPTFLDQDVEDLALVVDGAPQVHPLAAKLHDHLIQMPAARRPGSRSAKVLGVEPAELERPAPDCLVTDLDAARGQQLLDVAKAEGEAEIQPHGLADHFSRKSVSPIGNRLHISLGGRAVTS